MSPMLLPPGPGKLTFATKSCPALREGREEFLQQCRQLLALQQMSSPQSYLPLPQCVCATLTSKEASQLKLARCFAWMNRHQLVVRNMDHCIKMDHLFQLDPTTKTKTTRWRPLTLHFLCLHENRRQPFHSVLFNCVQICYKLHNQANSSFIQQ